MDMSSTVAIKDENALATWSDGESRQEQRREQTREMILEAAHRALVEVGYERITTRRIAEEADVNIATLHYYFGTKETLLTEAVRFGINKTYLRLRNAVHSATDAPTALKDAFQEVWELVRERQGVLRYDLVVRGLRDATARTEVAHLYAGFRELMMQILHRHQEEGGLLPTSVSPEHLAYWLVASVDGVILQHTVIQDDAATRVSLNLLLNHCLSLLGIQEAERVEILI
jgi:AcrR family transcriptional regulator